MAEQPDSWARFQTLAVAEPSRAAVVQGSRVTSFGELHQAALRGQRALRERGIGTGDRVVVLVQNDADCAAALLACWASGAIAVLVSGDEPAPQVAHACRLSEARLALGREAQISAAADSVAALSLEELARAEPATSGTSGAKAAADASIVFTSGSTGPPKGVTQTHASLWLGCQSVARRLGLGPRDRIACPVPWSFDYGYGQLLSTLLLGATQILPEADTPTALWESLRRDEATHLAGVPSLFRYLLDGPDRGREADGQTLRGIANTGSALPEDLIHSLCERFPAARLFLNYGLSESYRSSCLDPALVRTHPRSIGRAIPGVELDVLREDGSRAAPGETGEIVHRGGALFRGYWNDRVATAAALRPDPQDLGAAPVLFTGDLARRDESGLLYFEGRRDRQLKPMGVRVSPGEIERQLGETDLFAEVAVFGRPHDLMGDELWAAVAPSPAEDTPADALQKLRRHAQQHLSRHARPRRYLELEAMPRTSSGKIDYPRLEALADESPSKQLTTQRS